MLFEALIMAMVREMPVATLAGLVGETDMRIWRVVHHYVDEAVEAQELSGVERVGACAGQAHRPVKAHRIPSVVAPLVADELDGAEKLHASLLKARPGSLDDEPSSG